MWFKARYVHDILSGVKTTTVRVPSSRLPTVGDIVPASVGPIRPFAYLHIDAVTVVSRDDLADDRRREVESLVGEHDEYVVISFHAAHTAFASDRDNDGPT